MQLGHLKRFKKSVKAFHKACEVSHKAYGPNHPQTKKFMASYKKIKKVVPCFLTPQKLKKR